MARNRLLAAAFVAALAGVGAIAAPAGGRVRSGTEWRLAEVRTGRALLAHIPGDFRAHCELQDPTTPGRPDGLLASLTCRAPNPGVDLVTYEQFADSDSMQAQYDGETMSFATDGPVERDGCAPARSYSIDDQPAGEETCVATQHKTSIVYTYEPLLVVGEIIQYIDEGETADIATLNRFSDESATPISVAGTIPSLMSDAAARQAAADLRSRVPAAIRKHCTTNPVVTDPWLAASLECEHPSPGVWLARYEQYRDGEGFAAHFDPQRAEASSEEQNSLCPDRGTWSAGGRVRGRYACWLSVDNSYLLWSLDRRRIVVYAFAQLGDMTTQEFLAWWNDEAGPTT